jgi:hypothetical protein
MPEEVYGNAAMNKTQVYKWDKHFCDGHETAVSSIQRSVVKKYLAEHNVIALKHQSYSLYLSLHGIFFVPTSKKCSDRTIRKHQRSCCKSDENTNRGTAFSLLYE